MTDKGWTSGDFPTINFWKEGDPEIAIENENEKVEKVEKVENSKSDDEVAFSLSVEDAESLIDDAVEFYFSDDYRAAVHMFSQALEVLTLTYEQKELGEIWYYYGDSLLMLAKERSSFMSAGDFDEEGEDIEEEKVEKVEKVEGGEGDEQDIDVNEEFELAWQILELARIALSEDPEKRKELSNVHLSLANVAVESDNMEGAISEFDQSAAIRKELFGENDRSVAEVYYLKGIALGSNPETIEQGKESLNLAKAIIEYNLAQSSDDPEKKTELEEIISDLDDQILELSGEAVDPKTIREIVNASLESASQNETTFTPPTNDQPANDLTNSIKRGIKRKAEDPIEDERTLKKRKP